MSFNFCQCHGSQFLLSADARANFFSKDFIPTGWHLTYTKLSDVRTITLAGRCKQCYDDLEETISLPAYSSTEELFQAIYHTMETAHPYDQALPPLPEKASEMKVFYCGPCEERSAFYTRRDKQSVFRRNTLFLRLFHDYDREQARLWLEKEHSCQDPAEFYRDTGGSLFSTVIRLAKENGDFDKAEAILDYVLPCAHETGRREGQELTAYEFDFVSTVNYGGSEGIYLDCYLTGKFDQSGRSILNVGTLKTLRRDLEATKIMGELSGALMHHAKVYVNQELYRYEPPKRGDQL